MGLWSKIKRAAKRVANIVKAAVRALVKVLVVEVLQRIINIVLLPIGYLVTKKMRVNIVILHEPGMPPLISTQDAEASFQRAVALYKDKFDVRLVGYGKPYIAALKEDAPHDALNPECSGSGIWEHEMGEAGSFYASHLAGWNVIPISFTYPITVFVVANVTHHGASWQGCSFGPLTDYVVLTPTAMNQDTTLAHEIGHACGLLDRDNPANFMKHTAPRGTAVTGWQRFVVRTSRHVNFY